MPQLRSLYVEEARRSARTRAFLEAVEAALCAPLAAAGGGRAPWKRWRRGARRGRGHRMTHRLRQEVGSYALMAGTGFEHTDFLQCCKFAEGDSRVLMMKMARDRVGALVKNRAPAAASRRVHLRVATRSEAAAALAGR